MSALALSLDTVEPRFSGQFSRLSCGQLFLWTTELLLLSVSIFQPWPDHFNVLATGSVIV